MLLRNKYNIWLFSCFVCFFGFGCSNEDDNLSKGERSLNTIRELSKVQTLGSHRGANGYPENSRESIEAAIKQGFKIIEIDVSMTKDSVLVVHHDETIDRMSNGIGKINDYTYEELLSFNFGGGVI